MRAFIKVFTIMFLIISPLVSLYSWHKATEIKGEDFCIKTDGNHFEETIFNLSKDQKVTFEFECLEYGFFSPKCASYKVSEIQWQGFSGEIKK